MLRLWWWRQWTSGAAPEVAAVVGVWGIKDEPVYAVALSDEPRHALTLRDAPVYAFNLRDRP